MKRHLARRADELLIKALSEHEVTPGLIAALEYIAIKDEDHGLLNVLQQEALAAKLVEVGKPHSAEAYLPNAPTAQLVVREVVYDPIDEAFGEPEKNPPGWIGRFASRFRRTPIRA